MNKKPKTRKLQAPLIHLNGTSAERLLEAIENAYQSLGESLKLLREVSPNGRDYYPLEAAAMKRRLGNIRTRKKDDEFGNSTNEHSGGYRCQASCVHRITQIWAGTVGVFAV